MTGLKDIFRRRSRGKSLSGERPDVSDAPPSPARPSQPVSSSPRNTNTASQSANSRSTTPNPRTGRPQDSSTLDNQGAAPYEAMPSGRVPDKGNYPLHGNGGASGTAPSPIQSRRNVAQPGTALTTNEMSGQRSQSRASAYTDTSNYSEDAVSQRYNEDIPPVPQTYQASSDASNRGNARGVSQTPTSASGYGYGGNTTSSTRDPTHRRDMSSASVGSTPRTPIADEFSSSAWYKQRGSPQIPEFSEAHHRNTDIPQSVGQATRSQYENRNAISSQPVTLPPVNNQATVVQTGRYNSSSRGQQPPNVMDQSAPQGRSIENYETPRGIGLAEPKAGNRLAPAFGDDSTSNKARGTSVPQSSLDKPLPVPTEVSPPLPSNSVASGGLQQTLPIRESGRYEQTRNETKPIETNGHAVAVAQPVTPPRQQKATSATAPDSPSSPKLSGKYARPAQSSSSIDIQSGPQRIYSKPYIVEGAQSPPSLHGIVDLRNTVDTSTHVRYLDAVVHETVKPSIHHIREERVTREIHHYHMHHRILPVIDVLVLPTKHYARNSDAPDSEFVEIPQELIPARAQRNWTIVETVSKIPGKIDPAMQAPRRFTARTFEGTQGDYREYTNEQGIPTTETWWVHEPTYEMGAMMTGQTVPLEFE